MASTSEFARFEDRVDETIEKQIARVETKLDEVGRAVRSLAVVEDRQAAHARQVDELRASSAAMGERFEKRAVAMGERFDAKVNELTKAQQALQALVSMYVQRAVGVSTAVAVLWAVATHFLR